MPWLVDEYRHTNLWEITEIVNILNRFGFSVDIVDRNLNNFVPENKYSLFLGLGAGLSGKYFFKYGSRLSKAKKVLIAAGPEPQISNKLVLARYKLFDKRWNVSSSPMRLTEGLQFLNFCKITDYFLVIGEKGTFCPDTYKKFKIPILNYFPSSYPAIKFYPDWILSRRRKSFLCFVGNGFICKGVDILVEAFLQMPSAELHICGPGDEKIFFDVYGDLIKKSKNIFYHGFVKVGSRKFDELCGICRYTILASSSEGCATSVTTTLRAGMVPILTSETGVKIDSYGFKIKSDIHNLVKTTIIACENAMHISDVEYAKRVWMALQDSQKYTQDSFTKTFESAILNIIKEDL
ncbi:glycosyltransferase [Candidatus Methylopumilus universalis]|uniref:glycosyltransferase n=1 Tax=Candidatus Methylopumilus universalis TaxID=2588536 RepID=UPI003BEF2309